MIILHTLRTWRASWTWMLLAHWQEIECSFSWPEKNKISSQFILLRRLSKKIVNAMCLSFPFIIYLVIWNEFPIYLWYIYGRVRLNILKSPNLLITNILFVKVSLLHTTFSRIKQNNDNQLCWDELSHIDKVKMVCTLYKLLETFFPLLYGFGMVYISLACEVCALVSPR